MKPSFAILVLVTALISGGTLLNAQDASPTAPPPSRNEIISVQGGVTQAYHLPAKPPGDDVTAEQRAHILRKIAEYESLYGTSGPSRFGATGPQSPLAGPQPYRFFPQAGGLWQDLFVNNFADLDPSSGIQDWDCSQYTYDGHKGYDSIIDSFKRQEIGVPIFAALDGVVVDAHDGEPDMNTAWGNQPANYVILDHGSTHYTLYFHLKKSSVAVTINQLVKAGTQLGLTASSGISTGPHLHFESQYQGTWFEPSAGPCRAGTSNWVRQTPIPRASYARDFVVSANSFSDRAGHPYDEAVRTGTFVTGSQTIYFRVDTGGDIPPSSNARITMKRPDGSIATDFPLQFNNSSPMHGYWFWYGFTTNLDTIGTWRIQYSINGVTLTEAPVKVVASSAEITNRPPNPINRVTFDPASPTASSAIFCRVNTSLVTEDPDYDLVRYRYQWTLNGATVRDKTSAALSDALPAGLYKSGDSLTCRVTPSDGTALGPAAVASIPPPCSGSLTPTAKSFTYSGGSASVNLTIGSTCNWTAKSNAPWITLVAGSTSGTGSKTVSYRVAANTGTASRSGTLTIAGKTFTVTQSPPRRFTISGKVTSAGTTTGLPGVTLKLTSTTAGFTARTYTTTGTGIFNFSGLPEGRTYTLKPTKLSYIFTPVSRTYTNLVANQANQNFAGTLKTYSVSGRVVRTGTTTGIPLVTMTITSPTPAGFAARTVQTNSTGNYTFSNLPSGRNYTLKPTRSGFTFSPQTKSITNLSGNVPVGPATNFSGTQ
jgi:Peptidase family M23/Putative binding domain, N-terminal/Prealbumin-like fold domain